MAKAVVGVFKNKVNADRAVDELRDLGYDIKNISVIMKDYRKNSTPSIKSKQIAGGAAAGATTGAVIGGITGLLAGIGAIAIPGLGPLLIAGPLATTLGLTGVTAATVSGAATGALTGGILGSLIGLGIPEKEARVYEEYIRAGGTLLIVPTRNIREEEVLSILEGHKAMDVKMLELPKDSGSDREDHEMEDDQRINRSRYQRNYRQSHYN